MKEFLVGLFLTAASCLCSGLVQAQEARLIGQVTDSGEPLQFITVMLEGTSIGSITDSDGRYQIEQCL